MSVSMAENATTPTAHLRDIRSTIWRNTPEGWQILYHQGTIISDEPSQTTPQS